MAISTVSHFISMSAVAEIATIVKFRNYLLKSWCHTYTNQNFATYFFTAQKSLTVIAQTYKNFASF